MALTTIKQGALADDAVEVADLAATGTASATTFLRGDNSWAAAGGVTSDAQGNTVAGTNAGDSFTGTDAASNTLFGKNAGTAITSGDESTVVGNGAMYSATTGDQNVSIGFEAYYTAVTGEQNVAVGYKSLR